MQRKGNSRVDSRSGPNPLPATIHSMSSLPPRIVLTNLPLDLLVMDDRTDGKDERYYCLPPFYGTPGVDGIARPRANSGGYPFHLVSQGHKVGIHDNWCVTAVFCVSRPELCLGWKHNRA